MKKFKTYSLSFLMLSLLLIMSSCGGGKKDTISIYVDDLPDNLLPVFSQNATASYVNDLLFQGLTGPSGSMDGKIDLQAALNITQDPENKAVYDVKMRADQTWPDGRILSADDVIYTLDVISEPTNNSSYRGRFRDILKSYEKVGADEIKFTFTIPVSYEDAIWILKFKILPYKINEEELPVTLNSYAGLMDLQNTPVGTGEFKVKERFSNKLVLQRKSVDHPVQFVEFLLSTDPASSIKKMDNKGAEVLLDVDPGYYSALNKKNIPYNDYVPLGFNAIVINCSDPALSSPELRQALSLAVDRENMAELLYGDVGADYVMHNTFPMNETVSAYHKLDGYQTFDRAAAMKALDNSNGKPEALELLINNKMGGMANVIAEEFLKNLADIGIQINVVDVNNEAFKTRLKTGKYQLALNYFNQFTYKYDYYSLYHSYSDYNYSRLQSPELDQAVLKFHNSVVLDEKIVYAKDLNTLLQKETPYIYLFTGGKRAYYSKRITGVTMVNPFSLLGSLPIWSVSK